MNIYDEAVVPISPRPINEGGVVDKRLVFVLCYIMSI